MYNIYIYVYNYITIYTVYIVFCVIIEQAFVQGVSGFLPLTMSIGKASSSGPKSHHGMMWIVNQHLGNLKPST